MMGDGWIKSKEREKRQIERQKKRERREDIKDKETYKRKIN